MADDTTPGPLTYSELKRACANVGVDLECGRCAGIFFSGFALDSEKHTCDLDRRDLRGQVIMRPHTAYEDYLLGIIIQRNTAISAYRDEQDDLHATLHRTRRLFYDLQRALVKYGTHRSSCNAEEIDGDCACGLTGWIAKHPPDEEPNIPERIAKWILGYGNEPIDATLAAQAIREGKWR